MKQDGYSAKVSALLPIIQKMREHQEQTRSNAVERFRCLVDQNEIADAENSELDLLLLDLYYSDPDFERGVESSGFGREFRQEFKHSVSYDSNAAAVPLHKRRKDAPYVPRPELFGSTRVAAISLAQTLYL